MDNPEKSGMDVWALSQLGNVINAYVDRELNSPQTIANTGSYGIDDRGNLYNLGQPTYGQAPYAKPPINTTLVLLVLAAVFVAVNK
jgi:hypothetical protein